MEVLSLGPRGACMVTQIHLRIIPNKHSLQLFMLHGTQNPNWLLWRKKLKIGSHFGCYGPASALYCDSTPFMRRMYGIFVSLPRSNNYSVSYVQSACVYNFLICLSLSLWHNSSSPYANFYGRSRLAFGNRYLEKLNRGQTGGFGKNSCRKQSLPFFQQTAYINSRLKEGPLERTISHNIPTRCGVACAKFHQSVGPTWENKNCRNFVCYLSKSLLLRRAEYPASATSERLPLWE